VLEIFEFDPARRAYTGRSFKYRKDGTTTANAIVIGDMTNIADDVFVLIERDSLFGANAVVELDPKTLAVAIDTNFPGEDGRTPGVPDSTEFIRPLLGRKPRPSGRGRKPCRTDSG
jgi:hypothetical protein